MAPAGWSLSEGVLNYRAYLISLGARTSVRSNSRIRNGLGFDSRLRIFESWCGLKSAPARTDVAVATRDTSSCGARIAVLNSVVALSA